MLVCQWLHSLGTCMALSGYMYLFKSIVGFSRASCTSVRQCLCTLSSPDCTSYKLHLHLEVCGQWHIHHSRNMNVFIFTTCTFELTLLDWPCSSRNYIMHEAELMRCPVRIPANVLGPYIGTSCNGYHRLDVPFHWFVNYCSNNEWLEVRIVWVVMFTLFIPVQVVLATEKTSRKQYASKTAVS